MKRSWFCTLVMMVTVAVLVPCLSVAAKNKKSSGKKPSAARAAKPIENWVIKYVGTNSVTLTSSDQLETMTLVVEKGASITVDGKTSPLTALAPGMKADYMQGDTPQTAARITVSSGTTPTPAPAVGNKKTQAKKGSNKVSR